MRKVTFKIPIREKPPRAESGFRRNFFGEVRSGAAFLKIVVGFAGRDRYIPQKEPDFPEFGWYRERIIMPSVPMWTEGFLFL